MTSETTTPSRRERHARTIRQFLKFGIVGGSGVLVNMIVAVIMNKANGGTINAQNIIFSIPGTAYNVRFTSIVWIAGFLVANLWNFQLNRSWTFRSSKHATWWSEFGPFLAVGSAAAIVGLFIKIAMTNPTSPFYLPEPYFHEDAGLQSREYWSQLITIVLTMPINFVVNKLWTFRAVRSHRLHPTLPPDAGIDDPDLDRDDVAARPADEAAGEPPATSRTSTSETNPDGTGTKV